MLTTWKTLKSLTSRFFRRLNTPARTSERFPRRARTGIESLESRDLMSTSPMLNGTGYLPDPTIRGMVANDYNQHGSITFNDMISIYAKVERNGALTRAELISLENLAAYGSYVNMPVYVRFLAAKVAFGDPANASFGNLHVGSSANQVGKVAGNGSSGRTCRRWCRAKDPTSTTTILAATCSATAWLTGK